MQLWRRIVADRASGGLIAAVVALFVVLQGVALGLVSAPAVAVDGPGTFVHCITGSADETGKVPAAACSQCALCSLRQAGALAALLPLPPVVSDRLAAALANPLAHHADALRRAEFRAFAARGPPAA
jgi:hypothetical protein